MSLTFGPEFMGVALTPENATVTVTKWDGTPVTLTQNVVIDPQGRVSFTVAESGVYKITARRAIYNDYFSRNVSLSDGPDYDPSNIRSVLDYLLEQVADGSGGPGGPVDWDDVQDKPAVIAAGATQSDARTAIGAGTSNLTIGTTSTTAKAGDYQPNTAGLDSVGVLQGVFIANGGTIPPEAVSPYIVVIEQA